MGDILPGGVELETDMGGFGVWVFPAESAFWCFVEDFEAGCSGGVWGCELVDGWGDDSGWEFCDCYLIRWMSYMSRVFVRNPLRELSFMINICRVVGCRHYTKVYMEWKDVTV